MAHLSRRIVGAVLVLLGAEGVCAWPTACEAGQIRLKNGTVLTGKPVELQALGGAVGRRNPDDIVYYPILMVEDQGLIRHYVPVRQVAEVNKDVELNTFEQYKLTQRSLGRTAGLQVVGAPLEITPFDEYGRRRVRLNVEGRQVDVYQGITEITPRFCKVKALNYLWEFGIPTTALGPEAVLPIVQRLTPPNHPEERMKLVRFLLQCGWLAEAQAELAQIERDDPDRESAVNEVQVELTQLQARQYLDELLIRRGAGQYQLVRQKVGQFPVAQLSEALQRELRDLRADLERQAERVDQVRALLSELQAELPAEKAQEVAPLRLQITEYLHASYLPRLEPFLNLSASTDLTAADKLALALSGWLLGAANAIDDLDAALRLWHAQFLILQYLQSEDPLERGRLLEQIQAGEGVSPQRVAHMLPNLPPRYETPPFQPGVPLEFTVPPVAEGEEAVRYAVLVPPEYHPGRAYPVIVALHDVSQQPEHALVWWGGTPERPGQAQRYGYFVVAPEYGREGLREYDFETQAHRAVIAALRDAQQRFHLDADRVYLTGHGVGGTAAFDIGFSHPDLFAGLMPILGGVEKYSRYYYHNARHLPLYVLSGELDRHTAGTNVPEFNKLMQAGMDVIYTEYVGQGFDHYHWECARFFEWMPRHVRLRAPREIDVKTLRPADNTFWWWQFVGHPANIALPVWPQGKQRILPMTVSGKISPGGNVINLQCGAKQTTLWLSPELIDYEKRLTVRLNGAQKFNQFLQPDIAAMLQDFRLRGDRQRIVWNRLEL